jgi:alpha-L-fucosidase 2
MLMHVLLAALVLAAPPAAHDLHYTEPAMTWDEGFPLGNGILGALVWGDGAPLNISLDRTDLWDLRPVPEFHGEDYTWETMQAWEKAGRYDDLIRVYETPYHRPAPTKIPAGRITIDFAETAFETAALALHDATAAVTFANKAQVRVWIDSNEAIGFITVGNAPEFRPVLVAPAFGGKEPGEAKPAIVAGELAELGYDDPEITREEHLHAYTQRGWDGFSFSVCLAWKPAGEGAWIAAWSVASSLEGEDTLALAKARVARGLGEDREALRDQHEAWWRTFWDTTHLEVPNKTIERQWYLDTYKFGAAARHGAPPITLQGPWTADDGKLPPWKGDYHHDLNTQLSYWPAYSGNRIDAARGFVDWLWDTRKNCIDWTRRFYDMPGLNVPMTADLFNNQIGGWRQYTHSATTSAWLAHHFYLHWQFSGDRDFLETRAYPYLHEVATFLEAVTEQRDADGHRSLPLSSSPEINDNKPNAWFSEMTNYDNALIRWAFMAAVELAHELEKAEEGARWAKAVGEMPPFALDDKGALLVAKGHPLEASHRHFSHLMAIHPLGLIDPSDGHAGKTIDATLADLERLGTDWWCGYSFAWLGSLAARTRDGAKAEQALETFAKAFVLRNSFHCNGDQTGEGHSKFTYRPFTLEGNFAAAAGLQEMLIQSHTGVIEIFPAIPGGWDDIRFVNLRAQGGYLVSATLSQGKLVEVIIRADHEGSCRLRLPGEEEVRTITLEKDGVWSWSPTEIAATNGPV